MPTELNIGLIGLDTSHVIAFASLLNNPEQEYHVPGGRITTAFAGGSDDFELSRSRVEGFTTQLRDEYGVTIVDSPQAVAERCDAILLTSVDGRVHRDQFSQIARFGKPTFIDKPFATTSVDAIAIASLAREHSTPLMSCSSLRYAQPLVDALEETERGEIIGADCHGPMSIEPTQPGLFWYGIHSVEALIAILGPGCRQVTATTTDDHDVVCGVWGDGRIGTVRGNRKGNWHFGSTLHYAQEVRFVDSSAHPKPGYAGLLERVMQMFVSREPAVDINETVHIIRFIEAANESRVTGCPVAL
jgi:predicted dehydrogenase